MEIRFERPFADDSYPIYFTEKYLKSESGEYGWVTGYVEGKLICLLPYYIYSRISFRLLRFTNGVYFLDDSLKEIYEQEYLDSLVDRVYEINIDMIIQPTTNVVFDRVPRGSDYAPFGSYILDLYEDTEKLWKNLHSKHRNVIRNAEKKGVRIVENDYDIDKVYRLISDTFTRSSMGFMGKERFKKQIDNLGPSVKVFVAVTEQGELQGCAVIPFTKYSGYYLHGGSIRRPLSGSMNYLQWKVILSLKGLGVKQYDFVGARINPEKGSKLEGIQKFKERFGATLYKGYIWKYPVRPFKGKLWNIIYRILKKSKGDIIDQERKKERKKERSSLLSR